MNVKELIEHLQEMPQDVEVYLHGSDGLWDYGTPDSVRLDSLEGAKVVWVSFG